MTRTTKTITGEQVEVAHVYPGARRYTSKPCKSCGKISSVLAERANIRIAGKWTNAFATDDGRVFTPSPVNGHPVTVCTCRTKITCKPVQGRLNRAKECNARCIASKGHVCECSCGGKNHGAGHE